MKKAISLILGILLIMPTIVLAQTAEEIQIEKTIAGTTPDDGILYQIDIFFDNVALALTPEGLAKAEKRLQIAEERLAEMKVMADQGKKTYMEQARTRYQNQMNLIEHMELTEEEKIEFQTAIQKHIIVLEEMRKEIPDQAKPAIDNALENSARVIEKVQEGIPLSEKITTDSIRQKYIAETFHVDNQTYYKSKIYPGQYKERDLFSIYAR